jgi:hypothetical protein
MRDVVAGLRVAQNARRARDELSSTRAQAVAVAWTAALLWVLGPTLIALVALAVVGVQSSSAYLALMTPLGLTFLVSFVAGFIGNTESLFGRGHRNVDGPFAYFWFAFRYLRS